MKENYLSMQQASKITPYEQEYLSLLARRKQLQAVKIGKKWYTTVSWLNLYIKEKKPEEIIRPEKAKNLKTKSKRGLVLGWSLSAVFLVTLIFFGIKYFKIKTEQTLANEAKEEFVLDEIVKVPGLDGNYNIYGVGKMKLGEEKTSATEKNEKP